MKNFKEPLGINSFFSLASDAFSDLPVNLRFHNDLVSLINSATDLVPSSQMKLSVNKTRFHKNDLRSDDVHLRSK